MMNKGFTLIEVLIYSALVTIILSFSLVVTYQFIEFNDRGRHLRELADNQKFLEQKIYWMLQSVSAINTPVAGATSTMLSVNKIGYGSNPVVINFSNGNVSMSRGGGAYQPINNDMVLLQDFSFHQFTFSGQPAIEIIGTLYDAFTSTTAAIDTTILTQ